LKMTCVRMGPSRSSSALSVQAQSFLGNRRNWSRRESPRCSCSVQASHSYGGGELPSCCISSLLGPNSTHSTIVCLLMTAKSSAFLFSSSDVAKFPENSKHMSPDHFASDSRTSFFRPTLCNAPSCAALPPENLPVVFGGQRDQPLHGFGPQSGER